MGFDTMLWLGGDVADAAVIALFLYRRLWRYFPVFLLYVVWVLVGDAGGAIVFRSDHSGYATWYLTATVIDSILLFGVLVELAWSILRPVRASLSRRALIPVVGFVLAIGAAIWPFTALPGLAGASQERNLIAHLQQTVSIVQIIFFLALIACSQLLSIGWRDRELQIASGLGFFSFVGIATAILEMHGTSWVRYAHLFRIEIGANICTLAYLAVCFAQKEAKRREFTPEMQHILLAVAGAAHATRSALTDSRAGRPRKNDRR